MKKDELDIPKKKRKMLANGDQRPPSELKAS